MIRAWTLYEPAVPAGMAVGSEILVESRDNVRRVGIASFAGGVSAEAIDRHLDVSDRDLEASRIKLLTYLLKALNQFFTHYRAIT